MSAERGKIFAALSKAQKIIVSPTKNKTGRIGNLDYKYADLPSILESVKNPLATNGLCIIQFPIQDEKKIGVETMITHDSGEWISGQLFVSVEDTNAKSCGSALTYARRYAITAMLGLCPDDDDDGDASEKKRSIQQPIATTSKPGYRSQAHAEASNAQPSHQTSPQTTQNRQVSPSVNPNATQSQTTTKAPSVGKCDACKNGINQATLDFSMKAYHAPYCFKCQQEIKKGKEIQSLNEGPGN
jgi:hypothetical protein